MANLTKNNYDIIILRTVSTDTALSVIPSLKQKTDGKISIRPTVNFIFVLIKQSSREVNLPQSRVQISLFFPLFYGLASYAQLHNGLIALGLHP